MSTALPVRWLLAVGAFLVLNTICAAAECTGVTVNPGDQIQKLVLSHPPGTTFCFQPGTYRIESALTPKPNQSLIAVQPGTAILNGSKLITGFQPIGVSFVANGFLPEKPDTYGVCLRAACSYAQDVFFDGSPLIRVLRLADLASGMFYERFETNQIFLADDPAGHVIEQAFAPTIIQVCQPGEVCSNGVTVQGLVVEEAANRAQIGAIDAEGVNGWRVLKNEIRYNHGPGLIADGSLIQSNYIHENGQIGIDGTSLPTPGQEVILENEIALNNTAGYSVEWEAGGGKWAQIDNLLVRGNYVHDNHGTGLWCDINCYNATFENNLVTNNFLQGAGVGTEGEGSGIHYEISDKAVIRNNILVNNGPLAENVGFFVGANILVAASANVEVYGNISSGLNGIGMLQQARCDSCMLPGGQTTYPDGTPICPYFTDQCGSGPSQPSHATRDVYIHDNICTETGSGEVAGLDEDIGDPIFFTSMHNRYAENTYYLGTLSAYVFSWENLLNTAEQWRKYGQDTAGEFISLTNIR